MLAVFLLSLSYSCAMKEKRAWEFTGAKGEVRLMTLDPGHFHAALVQKTLYDQVSPRAWVYAPEGPDVEDHLLRIEGFNKRPENPTCWEEKPYAGEDYLERMLQERPGNVVILSGNNRKKVQYIKACVEAGLNVLADKPMCIDKKGFEILKEAFASAQEKGVLLYDIMTERSEITTILQKELANDPEVFGEQAAGSLEDPAVVKESVHHFFKFVAGNPIKRPAWFFDTVQQGEGIVDVTTHLIDLVMWGAFPGSAMDFQKDVEVKGARRWPTLLTREQFKKVTGLEEFPGYLKEKLDKEGNLPCFANGEILFTVKGIHARVSVIWNFQAPEGGGDTHYSIIRGSRAKIIIRQGKEQNYRPELYVEAAEGANREKLARPLQKAVARLQGSYPGIELEPHAVHWHLRIPDKYRIGHEAHFRQVTERYLTYLEQGKLPGWEVPNMITKYWITTAALEMAGR